MPRHHHRAPETIQHEKKKLVLPLIASNYPLNVMRKLLIDRHLYENIITGLRLTSPAAAAATYRRLGRAGVTLLSENGINKIARRSNNFGGLSVDDLKAELWDSLPISALSDQDYKLSGVITVGGILPNLAWTLQECHEITNERAKLYSRLSRLAGVDFVPGHLDPFVSFARFSSGLVPEETLTGAQKLIPEAVNLCHVEINPTTKP